MKTPISQEIEETIETEFLNFLKTDRQTDTHTHTHTHTVLAVKDCRETYKERKSGY
jgi:hypothetical protein